MTFWLKHLKLNYYNLAALPFVGEIFTFIFLETMLGAIPPNL